MAYAKNTTVSTEASRMEIERTLRHYKADAFVYAADGPVVTIMFRMNARLFRFRLTLPGRHEKRFTEYKQGHSTFARVDTAAEKLWEQACRQKWRALTLVIKAKLEAVEAGISTVEDEFLANTMMSDGQTVGEVIQPQIAENYKVGGAPSLMLTGPAR